MCAAVQYDATRPGMEDVLEPRGDGDAVVRQEPEGPVQGGQPSQQLSIWVVVALTSHRFYTGFLGATWVPFLIAKEGEGLVQDRQSLFMGVEKLIYGTSVLLNPIFGLMSDRLTDTSQWGGRSSFLLAGIVLSVVGICTAKAASNSHSMWGYLAASAVWMLGEAIADTTTETVVPELLPESQYDLAAAVRSLHFIAGGLAGYGALIVFQGLSHHWLYITYLCLMLLCASATVLVMRNKAARRRCCNHSSMWEAYIAPLRRSGDFARACFCMLAFSLGTAPIFFTLLMVRDLVRLEDVSLQQLHFSYISIAFLVCAAISSAAVNLDGGGEADDKAPAAGAGGSASSRDAFAGLPRPSVDASGEGSSRVLCSPPATGKRWALMLASIAAFGMVCAAIPAVSLPATVRERLQVFYGIAILLGMTFGAVYARFQTCLWSLLPPGSDVANAMGLAAVMKVAGCGLGNFFVGFILDQFRVPGGHTVEVSPIGYAAMCWFCSLMVFASVAILDGVPHQEADKYIRVVG